MTAAHYSLVPNPPAAIKTSAPPASRSPAMTAPHQIKCFHEPHCSKDEYSRAWSMVMKNGPGPALEDGRKQVRGLMKAKVEAHCDNQLEMCHYDSCSCLS